MPTSACRDSASSFSVKHSCVFTVQKRKTPGKAAAAKPAVQADEPASTHEHGQTDDRLTQAEEAPAAVKPRKTKRASGKRSAAQAEEPQDVQKGAPGAKAGPLRRLHKLAPSAAQEDQNEDAVVGGDTDLQTGELEDDSSDAAEPEEPRGARRKIQRREQQTQATAAAETAGESADDAAEVRAGEQKPGEADPTSSHAAPQPPQHSRASSQTNASSEEAAGASSKQSKADEQEVQVFVRQHFCLAQSDCRSQLATSARACAICALLLVRLALTISQRLCKPVC